MSDRPAHPDSGVDTGTAPGRGADAYPGTPRWVKVSGIVALVVILVLVIVMFATGGQHGPGRHLPSGDAGGQSLTPPTAQGVHPA
jgi:hypothetical protein